MHTMKIDFALLSFEEYAYLMNHISKQKEALADHMNGVISSKLRSLDKEIVKSSWEQAIMSDAFLEGLIGEDDLWN